MTDEKGAFLLHGGMEAAYLTTVRYRNSSFSLFFSSLPKFWRHREARTFIRMPWIPQQSSWGPGPPVIKYRSKYSLCLSLSLSFSLSLARSLWWMPLPLQPVPVKKQQR
jgi:hypothetical protein